MNRTFKKTLYQQNFPLPALFCFLLSISLINLHALDSLDDNWTVTVNGRSLRVNADGTFTIPNVSAPDNNQDGISDDWVRVLAKNKLTGEFCRSDFFRIRQGQTISLAELECSLTSLQQPASIEIVPNMFEINGLGQQSQIQTMATLGNGNVIDVTLGTSWTSYRTSNANIVFITRNGLVTAAGKGIAFITTSNEGTISVARVRVIAGGAVTQLNGTVLTSTGSPAVNATVHVIGQTLQNPTDLNGSFDIENVATQENDTVDVWIIHRRGIAIPIYGSASNIETTVDGITDIGIITLNPLGNVDTDNDGVVDELELLLGFDPGSNDTDNDGILDGNEDFDNDGIPDWYELTIGTDSFLTDTDSNGISDANEDFDFDQLTNVQESNLGTNALMIDTDLDTWTDFSEVSLGTDPLDVQSFPQDNAGFFSISQPTAFVNTGTQSESEAQLFSMSRPAGFVNVGTQLDSESQSFSISPATSFNNSP